MTGTFSYRNTVNGYNSGSNIPETNLYIMVNPNLQGRYPVIFGIEGIKIKTGETSCHAIVCDGYGYNASTIYHHLNLGWSGQDNAWYNLPAISTTDTDFTSITGCVYNVYTNESSGI